jgi:hypothetical protein
VCAAHGACQQPIKLGAPVIIIEHHFFGRGRWARFSLRPEAGAGWRQPASVGSVDTLDW